MTEPALRRPAVDALGVLTPSPLASRQRRLANGSEFFSELRAALDTLSAGAPTPSPSMNDIVRPDGRPAEPSRVPEPQPVPDGAALPVQRGLFFASRPANALAFAVLVAIGALAAAYVFRSDLAQLLAR